MDTSDAPKRLHSEIRFLLFTPFKYFGGGGGPKCIHTSTSTMFWMT